MPDEIITEERVIVLQDAGGTAAVPLEPVAAPVVPPVAADDPDAGLNALKSQLAAETARAASEANRANHEAQARIDAERRANAEAARARDATTATAGAQYDSIVNALGSTKTAMDSHKRELAAAMEAGDYARVAETQSQLSIAAANLVRLEDGKQAIERQREVDKTAPPPPAQLSAADRQEQFLRAIPRQSADWIRQRPQYFTDPTFKSKVDAAADYLEKVDGITYAHPDYYRKIEQAVGERRPDATSAAATPVIDRVAASAPLAAMTAPVSPVAPAARPVVAAAPSRTIPSANSVRGEVSITLTPEQRAHARATMTPDIIGVDPVTKLPRDPEIVYAQHLQDAQKIPQDDSRYKTSSAPGRRF